MHSCSPLESLFVWLGCCASGNLVPRLVNERRSCLQQHLETYHKPRTWTRNVRASSVCLTLSTRQRGYQVLVVLSEVAVDLIDVCGRGSVCVPDGGAPPSWCVVGRWRDVAPCGASSRPVPGVADVLVPGAQVRGLRPVDRLGLRRPVRPATPRDQHLETSDPPRCARDTRLAGSVTDRPRHWRAHHQARGFVQLPPFRLRVGAQHPG